MEVAFAVSYAVLWALVIVLALCVLTLARELTLLAERPTNIAAEPLLGRPSPVLQGERIDGAPVAVQRGPAVLLFVSPTCEACRVIAPHVTSVASAVRASLFVISRGSRDDAERFRSAFAIKEPVLIDAEGAILAAFGVRSTPYAIGIDADGIVRGGAFVASHSDLIAVALASAAGRPLAPREPLIAMS